MSHKDLTNKEAISKLKELVEGIDFTMMDTNLGGKPSHIVPMSTKDVDDNGNIWFLSNGDSEHNSYIKKDNAIQLIYSKPQSMEYLALFGHATILTDTDIIKKYYQSSDDAWFDGPEDPKVTAIKVVPESSYYWDTKNGKLTTLFKMGLGVITGEKQDLGVEGELKV
ncbi:pyridoxamine 5'-phosphate oxidase family protein [Fulvivirga ligni]|uniref:pyridoxamine 5'-phosphate oxidase family protein n=1 Tax=Fulvivirga ligni TaxID=2904246 RepID=UPI001F3A8D22|nr:pyridoxamine 5'-phosphate oxidase family protein [Fulvivirga ligni]UII19107.1 pyridoxamine 5'-phosphate oxidase family protein [Fulvivirga ligni]